MGGAKLSGVVEAIMEEFDVVVVGAGVIGSATAYQLLKHGASKVLLLEQVCADVLSS